jgi:5'-phosphate synthase pdxT subunit
MAGAIPRIGVLALQGDHAAHARALGDVAAEAVPVLRPDDLAGLAGLVIPGGESTALLTLLARDGLFEALAAFVATRPVFGTCAGAILLAREVVHPAQPSFAALDVVIARNAYGRQRESAILTAPTTLAGGPLETVFIRAPRIVAVGPGVAVLARRGDDPVLVRQGRVLAATFHPELSSDRRVHRLFRAMACEAADPG